MKKMSWGLLCIFLLCGCVLYDNTNQELYIQTEQPETETVSQKQETAVNEVVKKTWSEEAIGEESWTTQAAQEEAKEEWFYYSSLENTGQVVYKEILYALNNYIEEMPLSTTDTSVVDRVFQSVLLDHPEIFYADGYSYVKYTLGDEVKRITFTGTYVYGKEEKEQKEKQIETAALEILKGLRADASDYEKVKYVYETIIRNTEYDMMSEDNQNICSVFLNRVSVCQGYAKAVQYLLMKLQVPVTLVTGTVENGEGHAWNMVKIEDNFYYLDATWGDASYLIQTDEPMGQAQNTPDINYDYLCVTTEEILRTHSISAFAKMPVCDSKSANYYVREGAYFSEMNEVQLENLFTEYKNQGRESITLKCANEEVYNEMENLLIHEQYIFHYIQAENDSILYTDSPKQLSLTFWL